MAMNTSNTLNEEKTLDSQVCHPSFKQGLYRRSSKYMSDIMLRVKLTHHRELQQKELDHKANILKKSILFKLLRHFTHNHSILKHEA